MGIKQLYKHIGKGQRIALAKLAAEKLQQTGRPLRVAIDISIWQFQIQSGQGGKNPALRTLYYRLLRLLKLGIHPLFVFDGRDKPTFKRNKRVGPGAVSLPEFLSKQLLKAFGFQFHVAPGEAEAECALMQREGLVDAVLSEDVDTLMFGCSISLRNWSAEKIRGNRGPTHVDMYDAAKIKDTYGIDRHGMILIALMSGGDYIPEGIPGCGIVTACEAAKAGFGEDLCKISRRDEAAMKEWRESLEHEMKTNEAGFFSKRKNLQIPEKFPNKRVLGYYTHPAISSLDRLEILRGTFRWEEEIDITHLREFVADAFEWRYKSGAKKFVRGLAPALLTQKLLRKKITEGEIQTETCAIKFIHDRRADFETDGEPELRVTYVPTEIVNLDLNAEEDDPEITGPGDGSDDEEIPEEPKSPTKRKTAPYDPNKPEKIYILEAYLKLGIPQTVQAWEESMKDPKKFATRKARAKKVDAKMKEGAIHAFLKTAEANTDTTIAVPPKAARKTRSSTRRIQTKELENPDRGLDTFLKVTKPHADDAGAVTKSKEPSPCSSSPEKASQPVEEKLPIDLTTSSPPSTPPRTRRSRRQLAKPMPSKDTSKKIKSPSKPSRVQPRRDVQAVNPWTLSQRPADTYNLVNPKQKSDPTLGDYSDTCGEVSSSPIAIPERVDTKNDTQKSTGIPSSPLLSAKKHLRPSSESSLASASLSHSPSGNPNTNPKPSTRTKGPRKSSKPSPPQQSKALAASPLTPPPQPLPPRQRQHPNATPEIITLSSSPPSNASTSSLPSPSTFLPQTSFTSNNISPAQPDTHNPASIPSSSPPPSPEPILPAPIPLAQPPSPSPSSFRPKQPRRRAVELRSSLEGSWRLAAPDDGEEGDSSKEREKERRGRRWVDVETIDLTGSSPLAR
ncbi:MAG: hypothetical protein M1834_009682 [Cirrosporium novae-zelandiae]|nr:MAG: hypothetical protein M1834_009682 [Cirrosporium novae-zelandiae]